MTAPCAAARHYDDDEPPPCEPHSSLCRPCRAGLRRDLRRLPALDTALQQLPVLRAGGHGDGTGLVISEPAADCRSQIRHDLTWWCRYITADRGLDAARLAAHERWATDPVLVMCAWLAGYTDWIPLNPWAPDMAGAIAADTARAAVIADPWMVKRFAIPGENGRCVDCGTGRIVITIYASEGDRRRSFAACDVDGCGAEWLPEMWLRLGARLIRRRKELAS